MTLKQWICYLQFELWLDCFICNNQYILWLRRKHRRISKWVLLFTSPYLIVNWLLCLFYAATLGRWKIIRILKREQKMKFSHEVAVVAIAKNEGLYVREWVEFHRLVGITKIYLYDNDSNDDTRRLLQPYVDSDLIDYQSITSVGRQLDAYMDAIARHKQECRYMAFIDLDEYIMPEKPYYPIADVVRDVLAKRNNAAGIALNWCLYGNSGHTSRPTGLITENYIDRARETNPMNHIVKTLCNPRMVCAYISPHYPQYRLGAISVDSTGLCRSKGWFCRDLTFRNIRLNHYYCKSEEDYKLKTSRGLGDRTGNYDPSQYEKMNFNEMHDESMLVYKNDLQKVMR
jgi:hypothetical protein